jgi:sterol carrier protein 2
MLGADDNVPDKRFNYNYMTGGVLRMFDYAMQEYQEKNSLEEDECLDALATISYKNHLHSIRNPRCAVSGEIPKEKILNSRFKISKWIYSSMSAPTADGASAAILVSSKYFSKNCVKIAGQQMTSDLPFNSSYLDLVGFDMAKRAALLALNQAKKTIKDIDVLEVHDCFSCNELFMYEALGLCNSGKAIDLVKSISFKNDQGFIGKWVVNPSGGLESKGHPIGATGLAQCAELCWQLRGVSTNQIPNVKCALQHNFGLGSSCVVTVYEKEESRSKM